MLSPCERRYHTSTGTKPVGRGPSSSTSASCALSHATSTRGEPPPVRNDTRSPEPAPSSPNATNGRSPNEKLRPSSDEQCSDWWVPPHTPPDALNEKRACQEPHGRTRSSGVSTSDPTPSISDAVS